jgi:hypothetical protein
MKRLLVLASMLLLSSPALAAKACEELKAEIEAKIKANGVTAFTLTILPADQATTDKVVGTCDGGTKKIVYKRG